MEKTWQHHFPVLSAIVGVTLGLAFVWSGWSAKPAYANGPCQGPTVNHVGTYYDHVVAVYGVSANINGQQPLLCTGSNNSTTASAVWTTLGAGAIGNCGWAQVGYFKRPNLAIKVYAEYNRRSCDSFSEPDYKLVVWGTANSGTHNYKIRYKSGKHVARMWYDNYAIAKTPFDPGVEWGSQPWARMWSGETHDNGDDVPGSAQNPVYFTNLLYKNCNSCPWLDPGIPAQNNSLPSRYGLQQDAGSAFHIWTK